MKKGIFLSKNAAQTQKLAGKIAVDLLAAKGRKNAMVLALEGELGGGKTTFVQGLAKALGVKEKITSPTFVVMRRFACPQRPRLRGGRAINDKRFANLYHIDCYRIDSPKELTDLDFKEIISQPENLVVIEWADKVKSLIPKNAIWINFEWKREKERKIMINSKIKMQNEKI